jgi:uncharacterized protein (DUF4415 family)
MKIIDDDFVMRDEYDFSNAVRARFYKPKKVSTSLRLDDDVILYFKKKAGEKKTKYQTLMNNALREYISKNES